MIEKRRSTLETACTLSIFCLACGCDERYLIIAAADK